MFALKISGIQNIFWCVVNNFVICILYICIPKALIPTFNNNIFLMQNKICEFHYTHKQT